MKVYRILYWKGETMDGWLVPADNEEDAKEQFRKIIDDPSCIIEVKEFMR